MAYHFKRGETVSESVRRIACEQLKSAARELRRPSIRARDGAIHDARKRVKKVRSLLRLVEARLGSECRDERRTLGKIGRALSDLRDYEALLEIFDTLRTNYPADMKGLKVAAVRRHLVATKKRAERKADISHVLSSIAKSMEGAIERIAKWPAKKDGFRVIAPGLEKTLRAAGAAFAKAIQSRRAEDYHEWRKRVKDHWAHIGLLKDLQPEILRGYRKTLKDVEAWLGDDHNLMLLEQRVADEPGAEAVLEAIGKYRKVLRENAELFGHRIHQESPHRFAKRMRKLWKKWKATSAHS
jgi:CHAD domain-containing protein